MSNRYRVGDFDIFFDIVWLQTNRKNPRFESLSEPIGFSGCSHSSTAFRLSRCKEKNIMRMGFQWKTPRIFTLKSDDTSTPCETFSCLHVYTGYDKLIPALPCPAFPFLPFRHATTGVPRCGATPRPRDFVLGHPPGTILGRL